eukprot:scaffold23960_cov22-Tisochrysis_lutea.AAC.4
MEPGSGWHCNQCNDFDICTNCKNTRGHQHPLVPQSSRNYDETRMRLTDAERRERSEQLQKTMALLVHACSCNDLQCQSSSCRKVGGGRWRCWSMRAAAMMCAIPVWALLQGVGVRGWGCQISGLDVSTSIFGVRASYGPSLVSLSMCADGVRLMRKYPQNGAHRASGQLCPSKHWAASMVVGGDGLFERYTVVLMCAFCPAQVRQLFQHAVGCQQKVTGGCPLCKKMWFLLNLHAKSCTRTDCPVPRCKEIKDLRRRQTARKVCADHPLAYKFVPRCSWCMSCPVLRCKGVKGLRWRQTAQHVRAEYPLVSLYLLLLMAAQHVCVLSVIPSVFQLVVDGCWRCVCEAQLPVDSASTWCVSQHWGPFRGVLEGAGVVCMCMRGAHL